MPIPSKLFFDKTHKKSVYNIQSISNIPSVIRHGLLSLQPSCDNETRIDCHV